MRVPCAFAWKLFRWIYMNIRQRRIHTQPEVLGFKNETCETRYASPNPTLPPTAPSASSDIARSLASAAPTLASAHAPASALLVRCIDHVTTTTTQECSASRRCTGCAGE